MTYECPTCGEELELEDFQIQGVCLECQHGFLVEADGEFIDGMWRDRTKLLDEYHYQCRLKSRNVTNEGEARQVT